MVDQSPMCVAFPKMYKEFLVHDAYDGFVIACLPVAMKQKSDVHVCGRMSRKLHHNLMHYAQKILHIVIPACTPISITADVYDDGGRFAPAGVGCGLSCGFDSLCVLQDHYFDIPQESPLKLTHVVTSHAGASENFSQYKARLKNVQEYVSHTDLQLLNVNTTITSINKGMSHQQIHVMRNLAIPLMLPGLFKTYYYGSTYMYRDIRVKQTYDIAFVDPIFIPLMSTEYTELASHGCQYTRPQKTLRVSENTLAHSFLDVCVDGSYAQKNRGRLNCSRCWKCMRTQLILDLQGKLPLYSSVFDIERYKKGKTAYILKLSKDKALDREILELMDAQREENNAMTT